MLLAIQTRRFTLLQPRVPIRKLLEKEMNYRNWNMIDLKFMMGAL